MKNRTLALAGLLLFGILSVSVSAELRTWTDPSGKYKIEAEFIGVEDGVVKLRKTDGGIVSVPIDRLSPDCQGYVREHMPSNRPMTQDRSKDVRDRFADLAEKIEPSIVQVAVRMDAGDGLGSGFVVETNGLIITNFHVIEGARQATAKFSNGLSAEVDGYVAIDRGKDLALLRLKSKSPLPALSVSSVLPRKGAEVAAVGSPRGFGFSITQGVVSAVRSGQEVRDAIGGDAYSRLGYDTSATWIQTSAAISPGNSGGPLVAMDGSVVGVNSWGRTDAQNLNFAVSATDVLRLLQDRGKPSQSLTNLGAGGRRHRTPSRFGPPGPSRPAHVPSSFSIKLPSGLEFSSMAMELPADWVSKRFPRSANVCVGKYLNGKTRNICGYYNTKLHGACAVLFEDGHLDTLADYHMGSRDGWVRLWNEDAERLYFGEYKRGTKHGLTCVFRNDLPWYIQEYDKGNLACVYLVIQKSGSFEAIREKDFTPEHARECALARDRLADLESQVDQREANVKKSVREWFLEVDRDIKQERAAAQSVQARQAAIGRANARSAATASGLQELNRASFGGGR